MADVWNKEIETLSKDEAEALRTKNLKEQLKYVYEKNDFYKKKFMDAGATPEDIKTWSDFRSLPVFMDKETEKASRDESLEKFGHPFGMHLCVPLEEILVIKTTGGTTGLPTFSYAFTASDMARWNEGTARLFYLAGLRKGDRVLFCFPLSGCWVASIVKDPLFQMHIATVDVGAETPASRIIEFARMKIRSNVGVYYNLAKIHSTPNNFNPSKDLLPKPCYLLQALAQLDNLRLKYTDMHFFLTDKTLPPILLWAKGFYY